MKRRIGLCLMLMLSLTLNSCAFSQEEPSKVTITYSLWGEQECEEATMKSVEAFEALHPDIHVEVLMRRSTSGTVKADVMQVSYSGLQGLLQEGYQFLALEDYEDILDLTPYLQKEVSLFGDQVLGLPVSWDTSVMLYNQSIYKQYGLNIPKTWDDLFDAAEKMSPDGIYPICADKNRMAGLLIARQERITGKAAFSPEGEYIFTEEDDEAMAEFYRLLKEKRVLAPRTSDYLEGLENGIIAGIITSSVSHNSENKRIKRAGGTSKVGPLLVNKEGEMINGTIEPYGIYCIPANIAHKEEALLFLDYLVNSKENALYQRCLKGIPANDRAEFYLLSHSLIDEEIYPVHIMVDYYMDGMIVDDVDEMGEYMNGR